MHLDTDNLNALQAVIGDQVKDLLQIYLDSAPDYIEQMNQAFDAMDFAALKHVAHTLKGSAANIGAAEMANLCAQLEQFSQNQLACGVSGMIEQIQQESIAVKQAINDFCAN